MNIFTDNSVARQQEQQKLPKILACGIGGSLVFHGMAAVALNYLPKQTSTPIEVTLIDSSEIPPDLRPSPQPPQVKPIPNKTIAKVTPTPTPPTPTPSVKITPTPTPTPPTPTPSVKITPTPTPTPPTPTPSVKITPIPTPTPSVKAKPDLTPQVVKIVTKPIVPVIPTPKVTKTTANDLEKDRNLAKNSLPQNPSQQSQTVTKPSKKQVRLNPDQNLGASPPQDVSSSLNNKRLAFKNPSRSTPAADSLSNEPNSSAEAGNDQFSNGSPGNGNSSQAATLGNLATRNTDKIADSNGQPFAPADAGKFSSGFGSNGTGGVISDGGDDFEVKLIPGSGSGSRSTPGGSAGNNGNGRSLASARTGKFSGGSNSSGADGVVGDGNEFGGIPGQSGGSRSSTGNGLNSNGNSRSLISSGNSKLSRNSGDSVGSKISEGDFSENTAPNRQSGARNNSQSYIPELRCLENCQPVYTEEILRNSTVKLELTLDESGRVANVSLKKSSEDHNLSDFAENSSKIMRFELPKGFAKRVFKITMNFTKSQK